MSRNTTTTSNTATAPSVNADVVAAYAAASGDRKAQGAIRTVLKSTIASVLSGDLSPESMVAAQSAQLTLNALVADKPVRESVPAHVTLAQRIHDLESAAMALRNGDIVPEGMESVDMDALESALAECDGLSESARKIAGSKITRSTERNSISDVLVRAFDGQPVGTVMRISDVKRSGSVEGYSPSPGAIRATFGEGTSAGVHDVVTESGTFRLLSGDAQGNPFRVERTA